MPRNIDCFHANCEGRPCKALTAAELTPGPEDRALAEELVSGGWIQISAKYRTLLRWAVPPPTVDELVRPEYRDSHFARRQATARRTRFARSRSPTIPPPSAPAPPMSVRRAPRR